MRTCIYCTNDKEADDFSLEHIIPQFLGGSQAPNKYKTRDVCKTCNNNLGLFVDAGFEKDFLVYGSLVASAHAFYNPEKPSGLPLHCLGSSDWDVPEIKENETCENWIGPLGEQIFWIRPKDESMYWYSGGNPRTVKKIKSVAYFMFSENSEKDLALAWLSFKSSFEGRRIKKVLCTNVDKNDPNPKLMGFSEPDSLDEKRIAFFKKEASNRKERQCKLTLYTKYDVRFLAKLAIGISYSLFGEKVLKTTYMEELLKTLWYREGDELPKIKGTSALNTKNTDISETIEKLLGMKYATTLSILNIGDGIAINLNINIKQNWTILCVEKDDITSDDLALIGEGLCLVLFKTLKKAVSLSLPEFVAHNAGDYINSELSEIYEQVNKYEDYFEKL